jgi:hypothetical protein
MRNIGEGTLLERPKGSGDSYIKIDLTEVGCQDGRLMEQAVFVAIVGPKSVDDSFVNSNEIQQPIVSCTRK